MDAAAAKGTNLKSQFDSQTAQHSSMILLLPYSSLGLRRSLNEMSIGDRPASSIYYNGNQLIALP
jgi:hypothetical protein